MVIPPVSQTFDDFKSSFYFISHVAYHAKENTHTQFFNDRISTLFIRFSKMSILLELYLSYTGKLPLTPRKNRLIDKLLNQLKSKMLRLCGAEV